MSRASPASSDPGCAARAQDVRSPRPLSPSQGFGGSRRWPPKRYVYPLFGCLLGLGASLGLLVLRGVLDRPRGRWDAEWIVLELMTFAPTYVYVTLSTMGVLVILGFFLGSKQDRLLRISITDSLTGLFNRMYFDSRIAEEVSRSIRYRVPLTLIIIDLDRLKLINDTRGHDEGDRALLAVAASIHQNLRASDVAARYGGDEFVVILPETSAGEALALAERIRSTLSWSTDKRPAPPSTVSMGIADLPSARILHPSDLFQAADRALYGAKVAGRDRIVVARSTLAAKSSAAP